MSFTPLAFAFADEFRDDLRALGVEETVADRHALQDLLEGEGHAAADDDLVGLFEEIVDQRDLVGDLGPAEDRQQRALAGWSSTAVNALSSASIRNPATFCGSFTPTIDECARWAVPKASFT